MVCIKCGKENKEDSLFCCYCSTPIDAPPETNTSEGTVEPDKEEAEVVQGNPTVPYVRKSQNPSHREVKSFMREPVVIVGVVIFVLVVALILLAVISGIVFSKEGNSQDPELPSTQTPVATTKPKKSQTPLVTTQPKKSQTPSATTNPKVSQAPSATTKTKTRDSGSSLPNY